MRARVFRKITRWKTVTRALLEDVEFSNFFCMFSETMSTFWKHLDRVSLGMFMAGCIHLRMELKFKLLSKLAKTLQMTPQLRKSSRKLVRLPLYEIKQDSVLKSVQFSYQIS